MVKTLCQSANLAVANDAGSTNYWKIAGRQIKETVEANAQIIFRSAGNFSNLWVNITAWGVANSVLTLRKNATTDGTNTVTINATGEFEDTTHTDAVTAGDKWVLKSVAGASGTFSISIISVLFDASTDTVTKLASADHTTTSASTGALSPLHGSKFGGSTMQVAVAGTFKNAAVYVSAARATNTTAKTRKNSTDQAINFTLTGGAAGLYEDTTNTVAVAANDNFDLFILTGTGSDTLTIKSYSIEFVSTNGDCLIIGSANAAGSVADNAQQVFVICGGAELNAAGDTTLDIKARAAWAASKLLVRIPANDVGSNSTFTLRVGAADTALQVVVTANLTGIFIDSTHSVSLLATDKINLRLAVPSVAGSHSVSVEAYAMVGHINAPKNITKALATETVTVADTADRVRGKVRKVTQNNKSLVFDGVDDYLDCGNHTTLWSQALAKFSFSIWVYSPATPTGSDKWVVNHGDATGGGFRLIYRVSDSKMLFVTKKSDGTNFIATPNASLPNKAWQQFICVYDNSLGSQQGKLFINSVQDGFSTGLTEALNLSFILSLAASSASNTPNVLVKDFRFWANKALTQTEINDIYANNVSAPAPDYWLKLDEGTGNPVDAIGAKTTTLQNGATWAENVPDAWVIPENVTVADSVKRNARIFKKPSTNINSIALDGVNDYIDCGNQATLWSQALTKFSYSYWLYIGADPDTSNFRDTVNHGGAGAQSFRTYLQPNNGKITGTIRSAAAIELQASSDATPTIKKWINVVFTYDNSLANSNLKLYQDKTLQSRKDTLTETINLSTSLLLGGSSNDLLGSIKDFRFWANKALTQSEVNDVADNKATAPAPDYWLKLDEGTGNPVDAIGAKTTTLTNGAAWGQGVPDVWAIPESITVADSVTRSFAKVKTLTENVVIAEAVARMKAISRKIRAVEGIELDGVNDYIDLSNDASLWSGALSTFSISFWMIAKAVTDGNDRRIIQHGIASAQGFGAFIDGAVANRLNWRVVDSGGVTKTAFNDNVQINKLQHVVLVYNNTLGAGNIRVYIDRVLGQNFTLTQSITLSTTLRIADSGSNHFKGTIRDFRFWKSKALSVAEIDQVYNNDPAAPAPDYWLPMEEGANNPVDRISGTKVGTLTNGPTWNNNADLIVISDAIAKVKGKIKALTETVGISESVVRSLAKKKTITETTTIAEAVARQKGANRTIRAINGILFDGSNDYIELGNDATLWSGALSAFSISFWMIATAVTDGFDRRIIQHGIGSNQGFGAYIDGAVANRLQWRIRDATGVTKTASNDGIINGRLQHVVLTFDNSLGSNNLKCYIDKVVGTNFTFTSSITLSAALRLADTGNHFKGTLRDFRFWKTKALSTAEILQVYNNDPAAPAPDYQLKMQEGQGDPVDNISGTKTGVLTNGAAWDNTADYIAISDAIALLKRKNVVKALSETITIAENVVRSLAKKKTLSETVSISESVVRKKGLARLLSETVAISEAIARSLGKKRALPETVIVAEVLARKKTISRALTTESTTIGESAARKKGLNRPLATETKTVSDSITRSVGKKRTLIETVTITEAVNRAKTIAKALAAEVVAVSDSVVRTLGKVRTLIESVTISDVVDKIKTAGERQRFLTETVTIAENVVRSIGKKRTLSENVIITEALNRIKGIARNISETVTLIELLARSKGSKRALATETIASSESITKSKGTKRTLNESVTNSDSVTRRKGINRSIIESTTITELVNRAKGLARSLATETIVITGIVSRQLTKVRQLIESVTIAEAVDREKTGERARSILESTPVSDSVTRSKGGHRSLSETISITDFVNRIKGKAKTLIETIIVTDSVTRRKTLSRTITESTPVNELVKRAKGVQRFLSDSITITEALNNVKGKAKTLIENVTVSDSLDRAMEKARALPTETVNIADSVARQLSGAAHNIARAITETVPISDFVSRAKGVNRVLGEIVGFLNWKQPPDTQYLPDLMCAYLKKNWVSNNPAQNNINWCSWYSGDDDVSIHCGAFVELPRPVTIPWYRFDYDGYIDVNVFVTDLGGNQGSPRIDNCRAMIETLINGNPNGLDPQGIDMMKIDSIVSRNYYDEDYKNDVFRLIIRINLKMQKQF